MNETIPIIECGCCKGTGKIELPAPHLRTLQLIQGKKKPVMVTDLQEKGRSITAINNRCVLLEGLGLIRRAGKDGKNILWEVKA